MKDLIYIPNSNGSHIPCLFLDTLVAGDLDEKPAKKGKIIVYFHGNAEDLGNTFMFLNALRETLGVRIIAMEYRGYGLYGASQKSSEGLLEDALTVFDYIKNQMEVPESDIILHGRSLGCTAASFIASQRMPGVLVLMSPFMSLQQAAKAIVGNLLGSLIQDRFNNQQMLCKVTCPVFIVHGQQDELIPFSQSQQLIDACKLSRATCLVLPPTMTHNKFNLEFDFLRPLIAFFAHLHIKFQGGYQGDRPSKIKASLLYPPAEIIGYEKTIFFNSMAWEMSNRKK